MIKTHGIGKRVIGSIFGGISFLSLSMVRYGGRFGEYGAEDRLGKNGSQHAAQPFASYAGSIQGFYWAGENVAIMVSFLAGRG